VCSYFESALKRELNMTPVTREQFSYKSDLEVVHEPTGANVSTYKYESPADACSTITVNWGRIGDLLEGAQDYDRWEVARVGCELLRERARRKQK
jgi:hypothetical protein